MGSHPFDRFAGINHVEVERIRRTELTNLLVSQMKNAIVNHVFCGVVQFEDKPIWRIQTAVFLLFWHEEDNPFALSIGQE